MANNFPPVKRAVTKTDAFKPNPGAPVAKTAPPAVGLQLQDMMKNQARAAMLKGKQRGPSTPK